MKKTLITSIFLSLLAMALFAKESESSILDNLKADIYFKIGSAGLVEDDVSAGNDASFGGMYIQPYANIVSDSFHVGAKAKLRLSGTKTKIRRASVDCWDDLATYGAWEKAFLGISMPFFKPLWGYGGHGYTFVLPGSFFTILDDYAAGTRYGKDGVGLQYKGGFVTAGVNFNSPYASSSSGAADLEDKLQIGSGISFNFKEFDIPLQLGASVIYDNAKNSETLADKSVDYGNLFQDERDYTASFFVQFKPGAAVSLSGGYTINGVAMTTSSSFKHVSNYSTSDLKNSHIITLITRWRIRNGEWLNLSIEQEAEGAKSFDNGYYSAYGALRLKQRISGPLSLYPQVM
ncbi:MAG: hypothetical protein IJ673_09905, partial [Treponema sp.]|nr:hypothetical protein [Treponema sp.]